MATAMKALGVQFRINDDRRFGELCAIYEQIKRDKDPGTFRDPRDAQYEAARKVIESGEPWTVELLYGDHEGGQRAITRFTALLPPGAPVESSITTVGVPVRLV